MVPGRPGTRFASPECSPVTITCGLLLPYAAVGSVLAVNPSVFAAHGVVLVQLGFDVALRCAGCMSMLPVIPRMADPTK